MIRNVQGDKGAKKERLIQSEGGVKEDFLEEVMSPLRPGG